MDGRILKSSDCFVSHRPSKVIGAVCINFDISDSRRSLENLMAVLAAASTNAIDVLKTTIFFTDMPGFRKVHAVYGKCFPSDPPVRSCVSVAAPPRG